MEETTTIIPIASGKGGVGKTLLAANLCIALARLGHSTVAVDLDLGGSNLYTCLGVPNQYPGVGDYLNRKGGDLRDFLVPTSIENLRFLPGEGRTPFLANIGHEDRQDLARGIRSLKARYVVLDLGAGTGFSTLNFFGIAPRGLLVTTFETPAIMNLVMFLRNFMFRVVSGVAQRDAEALAVVQRAFSRSIRDQNLTVEQLVGQVEAVRPALAGLIRRTCSRYRPRIVFNMGDHPDELEVRWKISAILLQGLSLKADFFGHVFHDDAVRRSARNREVLITRYPSSPASLSIQAIARRIVDLWDHPDPGSVFDLCAATRAECSRWMQPPAAVRRAAG